MDRRHFMRQAAVTTLGALALPFASALCLLSGSRAALATQAELDTEIKQLTEQDVVELTLNYADSWQDALPGVNLRESLLRHLLNEQSPRSR